MGNAQVPDVSRQETQMWFYYQAAYVYRHRL